MTPHPDVLVVGAGPTGLALAAHLRAFGTPLRIIDRAPDRGHESCALAIQPRTLEVLAGLGVTPTLVACGQQTVNLCLHLPRRVVSLPLFDLGITDTAYPFLLFCPRPRPNGSWATTSPSAAWRWNAAPSWWTSFPPASTSAAGCATPTAARRP